MDTAVTNPFHLQIPGNSGVWRFRTQRRRGSPASQTGVDADSSRNFRGNSGDPGAMSKAKAGSSAMTSEGDAPATVLAKNNHLRIGDLFLAHIKEVDSELSTKWGTLWSQVPEKFACNNQIFEHLATFLVFIFNIASGDKNHEKGFLGQKTAQQIWSSLIQQSKTRFSRSRRSRRRRCAARACP